MLSLYKHSERGNVYAADAEPGKAKEAYSIRGTEIKRFLADQEAFLADKETMEFKDNEAAYLNRPQVAGEFVAYEAEAEEAKFQAKCQAARDEFARTGKLDPHYVGPHGY
jgi:hypothetical protein